MLGTALVLFLMWYLGRDAFRRAALLPHMTTPRWWLWIVFGIALDWLLLNISVVLNDPTAHVGQGQQGWVLLFAAVKVLFGVFCVAPICWLFGRWKRQRLLKAGPPEGSLRP